jgi:hypothetical protein
MSASTVTSAARVSVLDFEVSRMATPADSPHDGENGPGVRIVSRPRLVRREAVVSLDTSCPPAMLLRCGSLIR